MGTYSKKQKSEWRFGPVERQSRCIKWPLGHYCDARLTSLRSTWETSLTSLKSAWRALLSPLKFAWPGSLTSLKPKAPMTSPSVGSSSPSALTTVVVLPLGPTIHEHALDSLAADDEHGEAKAVGRDRAGATV